jgi:hypothetical protein
MADVGALLEAGLLFLAAGPDAYVGHDVINPEQADRCRRLFKHDSEES